MTANANNGRKPRFDFGNQTDPSVMQTGTLKELLAEINLEYQPASGIEANLKSLELALDFISEFTERKYDSITEPLPLSTLKTVKLLYSKNDDSGIQLFRRIARPGDGEEATMEFRTTESSNRNEYMIKIVKELIDTIALEISDERLIKIEASLLTTPKLLECIERENAEILEPIYQRFLDDSRAFTAALKLLTDSIAEHRPVKRNTPSPLHERVYTYLRTLSFFHWTGELLDVLQRARIDVPVKPIRDEIESFCKKLSGEMGEDVHADTPVTSIDGFQVFVERHALALGALVESATGIHSERRNLLGILDEANKVLHAYVFHQWHRTSPDVINLSVSDCVAALCTIRHQQKVKTTYRPFWIGQDQYERTRTRLLSHLGGSRSIAELYEHDYIPEGATQILHYRFSGFHMAFIDQMERHHAWLDFQVIRLQRYADCFLSNDVDCINREVSDFHGLCALYAIRSQREVDDLNTSHESHATG